MQGHEEAAYYRKHSNIPSGWNIKDVEIILTANIAFIFYVKDNKVGENYILRDIDKYEKKYLCTVDNLIAIKTFKKSV